MSENRFLGSISNSTLRNLLPKSSKSRMSLTRAKSRFNGENIAPMDPNVQISDPPLFSSNSIPKKPLSKQANPIKELARSEAKVEVSKAPDPPVKVAVRIRPGNGLTTGDRLVRGVSKDSVSVGDKKFTFDSIFDSNSTQEDVFQSVGVPLVKDALAGYNTSLLAYGQTGSGKTYTMWGPPSAMVEAPSTNGLQGIVPRIFQMLFDNIQREHENSVDKQISYQCRCSFLEIYNGHIGDLLDPMQRNLKIKDDTKNGFYVENLTEEYVSTYEDVTQILIKGLSNKKVGSTGVNSKSSRSHVVFTCIIESWCKENSSKCFGSSKTSRITLVDLAGFERNIVEDAGRQCIKEGKFVKKSTSKLGHLVNILSDQSPARVLEAVPYSSSSLTHLLRESLGGNAKLSVICTISKDDKHASDTISTLRFGKKVKHMKNEPVINEITEDDVNGLSDQIRLLKEELIRAKSSVNVAGNNSGYFKGHNTRESLNQLRVSLNRSLMLPRFDNDCEEEVHINEDDIKELQVQIDSSMHYSHEENSKETNENKDCSKFCSAEGCVTDVMSEHFISCSEEESENEEIDDSDISQSDLLHPSRISINTNHQCTSLQDPVLSESPKFGNIQRKSVVISSNPSLNENDKEDNSKCSERENNIVQSSLRSSRIFPGPTESLAASLHRGLQIIDHHHQQNSASMRSVASFSFDHFAMKPCVSSVDNVKIVRTLSEGQQSSETWIVPVDGTKEDQVPKESQKDLKQDLEREKLESVCKEQAEKIQQLSQLLAQCKCETQKSVLIDCEPINYKEKHLEWNGNRDYEQEIVKEIQGEVDGHNDDGGDKCFDVAERDALLTEIENLKGKLQTYTANDPINNLKSTERVRSSLLLQSIQLGKSGAYAKGLSEEEVESERQRWTEMESEWISLTDELRIDLESIRQRAEKVEMELKLEKKSTEELDDALQRSVLGHARMVEHYTELQEKYNDLAEKHRLIMQGIQDVKKAATKAGAKGHGSRFAKSLAAELSTLRVERERERDLLKKENKSLKIQLRDTAEAVHAAGELLVRLREAEETASLSEENFTRAREDNDKLKKQIEKLKRKHKMEMITMKQYLAESRLPEAALRPPLYREDSDISPQTNYDDDDQAWRAEFCAIYQEHHY